MTALDRLIREASKGAAGIYLGTLMLFIFGYPILWAVALMLLGMFVGAELGGGWINVVLGFGMPFLVAVFFAIYAWPDRVGPAVSEMFDAIGRAIR